jgi:hypothetical protein
MQFIVAKVPKAGCSEDAQQIMARLESDQGETLDLTTSYQAFEELISALNEAQSKADDKRRARGVPDSSTTTGDTTPQPARGFRYVVADDRSNMILRYKRPSVGSI